MTHRFGRAGRKFGQTARFAGLQYISSGHTTANLGLRTATGAAPMTLKPSGMTSARFSATQQPPQAGFDPNIPGRPIPGIPKFPRPKPVPPLPPGRPRRGGRR